MSALLSAALTYAARGWRVFPVHTVEAGECSCGRSDCEPRNRGKHPVSGLVPHGCHDATTDEATIKRWWAAMPKANVAIATGRTSGLWVLDLDSSDAWGALEDLLGDAPTPTHRVVTGRGLHLYYLWEESAALGNRAHILKGRLGPDAPTIDVRGEGGYVLAPPSLHFSGRRYAEDVAGREVARAGEGLLRLARKEQDPAPAPAASLVVRAPLAPTLHPYASAALEGVYQSVSGAREGERNSTLNKEAYALGGLVANPEAGLSRATAEAELFSAARAAGLGDLESRKTIASGLNDGVLKPREIPARDAAPTPDPPTPPAWGPPLEFHQQPVPAFPVDALPSWLGDYVGAVATATQVPADLPGMLALAALATCCAKRFIVRREEGGSHFEPVNLFIVVALDPGNRKSSTFSLMTAPIEEYERETIEAVKVSVAERAAHHRVMERALEKAEQAAARVSGVERDQAMDEVKFLAKELAGKRPPVLPRLIADDATPEKLAGLLNEQGGRLAVLSAEGGLFDFLAGRYTSGAPNLDPYLKGHAGDPMRIDRIGRPPEFVASPALTVGVTVQPEVLRGLLAKPTLRGRGVLGRFLYGLPVSLLGRRQIGPPPVPVPIASAYRTHIRQLLSLPVRSDGDPETVLLDPDAYRCLKEFDDWVEPKLDKDNGELASIPDWASKLVGAVLRIAALLHAAELKGQAPWLVPVPVATMFKATRLGVYLIAHARAAFSAMATDPRVDAAKRVLRWIQQHAAGTFTRRQLFQGLKGSFSTVADLDAPLALLEQHEAIRRVEGAHKGPGRKPGPTYEVNPSFSNSQNPQN
jgi:replicative DNA helicase